LITKDITSVTVTYEDGTTERFDVIGFHRTYTNYAKGAKTPDDAWTEHEIRWSDRK
jgi:hypothetical protein